MAHSVWCIARFNALCTGDSCSLCMSVNFLYHIKLVFFFNFLFYLYCLYVGMFLFFLLERRKSLKFLTGCQIWKQLQFLDSSVAVNILQYCFFVRWHYTIQSGLIKMRFPVSLNLFTMFAGNGVGVSTVPSIGIKEMSVVTFFLSG